MQYPLMVGVIPFSFKRKSRQVLGMGGFFAYNGDICNETTGKRIVKDGLIMKKCLDYKKRFD